MLQIPVTLNLPQFDHHLGRRDERRESGLKPCRGWVLSLTKAGNFMSDLASRGTGTLWSEEGVKDRVC